MSISHKLAAEDAVMLYWCAKNNTSRQAATDYVDGRKKYRTSSTSQTPFCRQMHASGPPRQTLRPVAPYHTVPSKMNRAKRGILPKCKAIATATATLPLEFTSKYPDSFQTRVYFLTPFRVNPAPSCIASHGVRDYISDVHSIECKAVHARNEVQYFLGITQRTKPSRNGNSCTSSAFRPTHPGLGSFNVSKPTTFGSAARARAW